MAFIQLHINSSMLGMATSVNAVVPQMSDADRKAGKRFPVLYLLHGLSDDETIWMRRTSIERYASKYGVAVIMPRGDRSFYTDMAYGPKYFSYISEELPETMQGLLPLSDRREDNYIGGLSMGGYGALKTGLRKNGSFAGIIALSSVADIVGRAEQFSSTYRAIFDGDIPDSENIFALSQKRAEPLPRIFMGVGLSDFLYEDNIKLRDHLKALKYDVTYRESEGSHSWDFWDEYIQYGLEWAFGKK